MHLLTNHIDRSNFGRNHIDRFNFGRKSQPNNLSRAETKNEPVGVSFDLKAVLTLKAISYKVQSFTKLYLVASRKSLLLLHWHSIERIYF